MGRGRSSEEKIPGLGEALKWLREDQRATQQEIADASGLSKVYYGQIERGERYPAPQPMEDLCRALGVDEQRVKIVAATRPWEQLAYESRSASAYRVRKKPVELDAFMDMDEPQLEMQVERQSLVESSDKGMFSRRRRSAAVPFGRSMDAVEVSASVAPTPALPIDTDSAELMAIYQKLSRTDQLTVLGVARSLGRHLDA
jgi:transcriptional regulator with XRE-family HTH domain